jgi:hypothetical protein
MAGSDACCGCVPTQVTGPITLFHQPPPPEPVHAPTVPFPGVVIFRREPLPPQWVHGAPLPPVRLFRAPPPPITLMRCPPPPVQLFRKEVPPPVWSKGNPVNPVVVFRKEPLPPRYAPTQVFPGPTLFEKPQPPAPCLPADCCPPGAEGPPLPAMVVESGHVP